MPLKKSARSKTSAAAKKTPSPAPAPPEQPAPERVDASMDSSRMMGAGAVLLVFCVMAAAMLLAARESVSPARAPRAESAAEVTAPADVDTKAPPARTPMARVSTHAPAAAAKSTVTSPFVTITGCLERGDDAFRLTHTDGSDAPRSRSWKSGFLKKGPAAVEIVDQTNRVKLSSHVGQRVSVTGPLEERQMQVRSLRRIAPACE